MGQHPPKSNRSDPICFSPYLYRARNFVERFFNKIKQCRRVATRYDRLAATTLPSSNSHLSAYSWPGVMSPPPSERGTAGKAAARPIVASSSRTGHCSSRDDQTRPSPADRRPDQ